MKGEIMLVAWTLCAMTKEREVETGRWEWEGKEGSRDLGGWKRQRKGK